LVALKPRGSLDFEALFVKPLVLSQPAAHVLRRFLQGDRLG